MRTAATALRLEPSLKHRAEVLAEAENRSFSAVKQVCMLLVGRRQHGCELGGLTTRVSRLHAIADSH